MTIALAACSSNSIEQASLADQYRELGLDFDERELNDGRDAYSSDLEDEEVFVELIDDPVAEASVVFFDVDGADFESTDFPLADYAAPAERMIPGLRDWIVQQFEANGAGDWNAITQSGDWTLEAEYTDDWLGTGVGALDMHFERLVEDE